MSPSNRKHTIFLSLSVLATICLGALNSHAGARTGGDNSGGGNAVNRLLIEDYALLSQKLPDFNAVEKYLKIFDERVPKFGEKLRLIAKETSPSHPLFTTWYLIPDQLTILPAEITGLRFPTNQVAYQVNNEIFISEHDLRTLSGDSRGKLYLHEILMMARKNNDKDAGKVRQLMIFLKRSNYAPEERDLREALEAFGFWKPSDVVETKPDDQVIENPLPDLTPRILCAKNDGHRDWDYNFILVQLYNARRSCNEIEDVATTCVNGRSGYGEEALKVLDQAVVLCDAITGKLSASDKKLRTSMERNCKSVCKPDSSKWENADCAEKIGVCKLQVSRFFNSKRR